MKPLNDIPSPPPEGSHRTYERYDESEGHVGSGRSWARAFIAGVTLTATAWGIETMVNRPSAMERQFQEASDDLRKEVYPFLGVRHAPEAIADLNRRVRGHNNSVNGSQALEGKKWKYIVPEVPDYEEFSH